MSNNSEYLIPVWNPEYDTYLENLVKQYSRKWSLIAVKMGMNLTAKNVRGPL